MKKLLFVLFGCGISFFAQSQLSPEITSWILQVNGLTGYNGYPANVQQVNYTSDDVYVTCSCIPGYDIGPWAGNPNIPVNKGFCFKITRHPQQNTGTLVVVDRGHVGVWSNGVSIFSAVDAISYNMQNVWHQDALPNEGASFDDCLGHPAPGGEYHNHVNPRCLYDDQDMTHHSPIIGYAFDGFPIYGAYAYTNTDGTGAITRMRTSYRMRNITTRTILPDGSTASSAGPAVSLQFPLGKYIEDYEYVSGLGELDVHNGRFCVTPEYPGGIYAYFVSIDANQTPVYPYTLGPHYYGTVQAGNTGMGPTVSHNPIPSNAIQYTPTSTAVEEPEAADRFAVFPNPSNGTFFINTGNPGESYTHELFNAQGSKISENICKGNTVSTDISALQDGMYILRLTTTGGKQIIERLGKVSH